MGMSAGNMALRHPAATGRNLGKLLAALSIAVKSEPASAGQRQRRSIAEKRRIVEQALVEGASVARIARAHGVNANQLFGRTAGVSTAADCFSRRCPLKNLSRRP